MTPEIRDALQYCPNLPHLSPVTMRLVEMARDPDVGIGALVAVLAREPAIARRVLRVNNSSPLHPHRQPSDDLHGAVVGLGLDATMSLALGVSLAEPLRHAAGRHALLDKIRRRALISALVSRVIAKRLERPDLETLQLAALVQDLGVVALETALSEPYLEVLEQSRSHDDLLNCERRTLGADHGEAGAWLMDCWGLPKILCVTAMKAHDRETTDDNPDVGTCSPGGEGLLASAESVMSASNSEEFAGFVPIVALSGRVADLFLSEDLDPATTKTTAHLFEQWLGLGRAEFNSVLTETADGLSEVEAWFEEEVMSRQQATDAIDQARAILAIPEAPGMTDPPAEPRRAAEPEVTPLPAEDEPALDPLTGLQGAAQFDLVVQHEASRALQNHWPLAVAFIDVDHLENINRRHGRELGDRVLISVANVLRDNLRDRDFIMRYRGDTFAAVLPGAGADVAARVVERLRQSIEYLVHRVPDGENFAVTVSLGCASVDPKSDRPPVMQGERDDAQAAEEDQRFAAESSSQDAAGRVIDLALAAEQALCEAKARGGNAVVLAGQ